MKGTNLLKSLALLMLLTLLVGCDQLVANIEATNMDQPEAHAVTDNTSAVDHILPKFYTSHEGHENLSMIGLEMGDGTHIGAYTHPDYEINRTIWFAPDGAVYKNDFYAILNRRLTEEDSPDKAESRLARININSGEIEHVGDPMNLNMVALEIDHCGNAYAAGFSLTNAVGAVYGDTNLYQIGMGDGSMTLIGDTGLERIMDLSFHPDGTLWATVGNVLYTLDMETGAPTAVTNITGVEEDNEIMGIGFTSDGTLYGTSPWIDGLYTIDPDTGEATEVGRHGLNMVHGGDIPMHPYDASCQ